MKNRAPEFDLTSLGNVVAALYNVSIGDIWSVAQEQGGKIGQRLVRKGFITQKQLDAALESQRAMRAKTKTASQQKRDLAQDLCTTARDIYDNLPKGESKP